MKNPRTSLNTVYSIASFVSFVLSAVSYVLAYTQTVYLLIPAGLLGFLGVVFLGLSFPGNN